MALHDRTLRFKLYSLLSLPIVALIVLWSFITGHIVGDFFDLRRAVTLSDQVATPAAMVADHVQQERQLSAAFLSSRAPDGRRLSAARAETDRAVVLFHQRATSLEGQSAVGPEVAVSLAELERALDRLSVIRQDVDGRSAKRLQAVLEYTEIQDSLYKMYDQLVTVPDLTLYRKAAGLQTVVRSRELLSQEDALLSGAILQGSLQSEEQHAFVQMVSGRRLLLDRGLQSLDTELRRPLDELLSSADYKRFTTMENQVVSRGGRPDQSAAWQPLANSLGSRLDQLVASRSRLLNERTDAAASAVITQIVGAAGLGLVAILLAVILSTRLGRGLTQELAGLRSAALDLADVRLPRVVAKLRESEPVDVESETPPIRSPAPPGDRQTSPTRSRPYDGRGHRGRRRPGRAPQGRQHGFPQPRAPQPVAAAPPALQLDIMQQDHAPEALGRPLPARPPHHAHAPPGRGPDHPVRGRPRRGPGAHPCRCTTSYGVPWPRSRTTCGSPCCRCRTPPCSAPPWRT